MRLHFARYHPFYTISRISASSLNSARTLWDFIFPENNFFIAFRVRFPDFFRPILSF